MSTIKTIPNEREAAISYLKTLLDTDVFDKEVVSTIGVYNDGSRKENAVSINDLMRHIEYNQRMRPGRAFFVEGHCINKGYLSDERIDQLELEFKNGLPTYDKPQYPYF